MKPAAQHQFAKHQQQVSRLVARIGLALFMLMPSLSQALEFQCELGGDIRQLSVVIPGEQHLCEVTIDYESTGEHKVLWHADNDTMFCSAKAYALINKYDNEWGFSCAKWPDRDGIDELSPTQRSILDLQLRKRMVKGESADEPVTVTAVKAAASTPLDHEPGTLAIQYFLSDGSDQTEIIVDNDTSWKLFATIDDLASRITGDHPVDIALVSTITDGGALEIVTTLAASNGERDCHGKQVLMPDANAHLSPRTPHRVVCQARALLSSQSD